MTKHPILFLGALAATFRWQLAFANVQEQLSLFADDLTGAMYSSESNDCTSSLGVSMAFDLVYPSASGDSKTQMEEMFGFSDPATLHWAANDISTVYKGNCYDDGCDFQDPLVSIANRVWTNDQVTLHPDYAAVVGDLAEAIDFSNPTAKDTINKWVDEATNGLIDSIVQDVNSAWILLAVNSIYLKAAWRFPFQTRFTTLDAFGDSDAHFMHAVDYLDYSSTAIPNHQVVKLPFFGGSLDTRGLSMVFVVPTSKDLRPSVSSAEVISVLPSLENDRVALGLPKFKFDTTYASNLEGTLKALGLTAPFEGGLCIREGSCGALIDFIVQKTSIDVNEDGVEAAAVTAIGVIESVPLPTAPELMILDRPFQFWILHDQTALFEGRVINPGIPSGSVATEEKTHTDPSFWRNNFFVDDPIELLPNVDATVDALASLRSVQSALPALADDLTASMYSEESNDCTSTLGISMAFDLLYSSASGDSKSQMETMFGFVEPIIHWAASDVSSVYEGTCYGEMCDPVVSIANRVWVNNQVSLNPEYEAVVNNLVEAIDFTSATAADTINAWVDEVTNGLIDSIVQQVNPSWILLAVNSIYLKAGWKMPFETRFTTLETFGDSEAHFMHAVGYWGYSATAIKDHQIIQLGFFGRSDAANKLSMVFVVPTIKKIVPSVSSSAVLDVVPDLKETRVGLGLPKFKFDATYAGSLRSALVSLGLEAPFEDGLCVREGSCGAFIDFIVQKTSIDVNELGVEAAAVTALGVTVAIDPTRPELMIMDRPFQFWILHNHTALFEGRVVDPGIPEGSVAASGATHNSARFWQDNFFTDDPIRVDISEGTTSQPSPVASPTKGPTSSPTGGPTMGPTASPTVAPAVSPSASPMEAPTLSPASNLPSSSPTMDATQGPTLSPTLSNPTSSLSQSTITESPSLLPSAITESPSLLPSAEPSEELPTASTDVTPSPTAEESAAPSQNVTSTTRGSPPTDVDPAAGVSSSRLVQAGWVYILASVAILIA